MRLRYGIVPERLAANHCERELWPGTQSAHHGAPSLEAMATKYFTHFVTGADEARYASEWSGVVELARPLEGRKGAQRELRALIAENFELESAEIRILHWARLH